ncbi:MAG: SET domain-containing protein [Chloroherpetonaceae bacterium]|nr:SET domain-containing protein [Chloroherpetonaceae bacterium]MCS7211307.1 SET domain-containing protein [Chloroherpetonaceae bacterium]MDW8019144.1 SET domain-containing protein [Chloroherpetonaceae bacterium]MDW8466906.1 SET domain-containing protein [Chloroherpetonaceae bacterium]
MLKLLCDEELLNPPYIKVCASPIQGYGLFTEKACREKEVIMVIAGEVIDGSECLRRENEENNVYIFYLDEERYLDTAQSDKIRYINHSCEPNCIVCTRNAESLYLVAAREIAAGEELTIDYDFEEIYELCQKHNPNCKKEQCKVWRAKQVL